MEASPPPPPPVPSPASASSNISLGSTDAARLAGVDAEDKEEKNPWSRRFLGIPVNYFSVGLVYGGSVNMLYPLLIIQNG
ncbi:hypothetical protein ACHAWF_000079, partial [Thalassiosira exigua]